MSIEIKKDIVIPVINTREELESAMLKIMALEEEVKVIKKAIIQYEYNEKKRIWDACDHSKTTGWREVGHDSHKRYFEEKCLKCGKILREDDY